MVDTAAILQHFTYFGIFCLLILGGVGLPFPEDGVLIATGLLIAQGVVRLVPAVLVIYPSLLIADLILYSIGRKYGRMIVEHPKFSRMVPPATFLRFERKFTRWGALMVFLGRHFAGFRAPVFVIAGVMRISRLKFVIADGLSAIITVSAMLSLGYFGGRSLKMLKHDVTRTDYILVLALALSAACLIIARYYRDWKKGRKRSQ